MWHLNQNGKTSILQTRSVTDLEKESLFKKLQYLKLALNEQYIKTIRKMNLSMFTPVKLQCVFGEEQIEQILKHCEHIFCVVDILKDVDI